MKNNETITEYAGLGEQDEILENKVAEIVAKFNAENNADFIYVGDDYYWAVRSEHDPDLEADFDMAVVYDDESMVTSHTPAEEALVNDILDAMQECSARQGFPESLRFSDYED